MNPKLRWVLSESFTPLGFAVVTFGCASLGSWLATLTAGMGLGMSIGTVFRLRLNYRTGYWMGRMSIFQATFVGESGDEISVLKELADYSEPWDMPPRVPDRKV